MPPALMDTYNSRPARSITVAALFLGSVVAFGWVGGDVFDDELDDVIQIFCGDDLDRCVHIAVGDADQAGRCSAAG